jgi:hypothetical protein
VSGSRCPGVSVGLGAEPRPSSFALLAPEFPRRTLLGSSRPLGVTSPLPRADGARERGILSVGNYGVDMLSRNVVLPPAVEKVAARNHVLLKPLFVIAYRQRNRFAFGWYVTDRSYLILVKDLTVRVPVLESDVGTHASRFRFHTPQCTLTRPLRCAPVLPLPLWSAFFTRSPSLVPDSKI